METLKSITRRHNLNHRLDQHLVQQRSQWVAEQLLQVGMIDRQVCARIRRRDFLAVILLPDSPPEECALRLFPMYQSVRQCAVLTSFADFAPGIIALPKHFFRDGGVPCLLAKKTIGIRSFR